MTVAKDANATIAIQFCPSRRALNRFETCIADNIRHSLLPSYYEVMRMKETGKSVAHPTRTVRNLKFFFTVPTEKRFYKNTCDFSNKARTAQFDFVTSAMPLHRKVGLKPRNRSIMRALRFHFVPLCGFQSTGETYGRFRSRRSPTIHGRR